MSFTEERMAELGVAGFFQPFTVSCKNHAPGNKVYIQQWDGTTWQRASDWFESDRAVVWPLLEKAAADYVAQNPDWPKRAEPCA
jgi:branched-chain amino acid transport system substrate-binding protein